MCERVYPLSVCVCVFMYMRLRVCGKEKGRVSEAARLGKVRRSVALASRATDARQTYLTAASFFQSHSVQHSAKWCAHGGSIRIDRHGTSGSGRRLYSHRPTGLEVDPLVAVLLLLERNGANSVRRASQSAMCD